MRTEQEIRKELDILRKRHDELNQKLERRMNTSFASPIIEITQTQMTIVFRKIILLEWVLGEREDPTG